MNNHVTSFFVGSPHVPNRAITYGFWARSTGPISQFLDMLSVTLEMPSRLYSQVCRPPCGSPSWS
ncbi:hypothetical protein M404DRAFT_993251 [Pisolithus tinctorius Marx 270]|uniref:Uncharacterized protein n=1 Tax=Pisolithus tinctorius Marx 270 TaxID=870435 RepID=A0A0C3KVT2_PISTI|nr:hypothetical protein M404DRAFT_993251 [Pisolithus tinctorius Marx 270]